MEEKVDIILATYNTKIEYLKEQIESILNQTYKNFDLIISDDNSSNKEIIEILKKYEEKDKRIKIYIQEKNLGYLKNFEFLLNKTQANYIMFSDHDDIWYPEKIEKSLKEIIKRNVDLVYTDAKQINENGEVLHESYLKCKNMPFLEGNNDIHFFSRHTVIGCSQIFTKYIKEQILPFTSNTIAHDWITVYIASKAKGVAYIEEPMLGYRLHETNIFGGRNLNHNIKIWKKENGNTYKSYLKYRKTVIDEAYLKGALMCFEYSEKQAENKEEKKVIEYYANLKKSKIINFNIRKYFKYLYFKNGNKRAIKEIILFHFPIIGYIAYIIN